MKAWGLELARMASIATVMLRKAGTLSLQLPKRACIYLPSVPFLNPMGKDTPDASSRWSCDSVVRAPMAPHEITLGASERDGQAIIERDAYNLQYTVEI